MTTRHYEEDRKRLRINIKDDDLREWGLSHVDDSTLRNWIKVGQEREEITSKLNQLEDKLDRFIKMIGQFSHQTFVATAELQNDIDDKLKELKGRPLSEVSSSVRAIKKRYDQSYKLRDQYFPEFKIPTYLDDSPQHLSLSKDQSDD